MIIKTCHSHNDAKDGKTERFYELLDDIERELISYGQRKRTSSGCLALTFRELHNKLSMYSNNVFARGLHTKIDKRSALHRRCHDEEEIDRKSKARVLCGYCKQTRKLKTT